MTSGPGLRRFVRGAPAAPGGPAAAAAASPEGPPAAACEMCAAEIPADHGHVADLHRTALLCACRACYLLFTHAQAGRGRYRAVPDRWLADPAHPLSAAEWDQLQVPVGLAFFLRDSRRGGIAGFYPSPAGVTESRLDLAAWDRLAAGHPLLQAAEPDVEAVLICKDGEAVEHFLVPVDVCYELAGRMRLLWRGFDGGAEARASMGELLDRVRARARPAAGPAPGAPPAADRPGQPAYGAGG
ncbi:MAG TPA: DUF5947 family protein [Streptosporangiaceae bacterium]|nr:DUF5947 family protein [Streptosporangiaceae bacterium]